VLLTGIDHAISHRNRTEGPASRRLGSLPKDLTRSRIERTPHAAGGENPGRLHRPILEGAVGNGDIETLAVGSRAPFRSGRSDRPDRPACPTPPCQSRDLFPRTCRSSVRRQGSRGGLAINRRGIQHGALTKVEIAAARFPAGAKPGLVDEAIAVPGVKRHDTGRPLDGSRFKLERQKRVNVVIDRQAVAFTALLALSDFLGRGVVVARV
jgi:hypothetical protein